MAERPLWQPSEERIEEANLTRFARQAIRDWKLGVNTYRDFYRWTTDRPEQFWESLWRFAGVRASRKGERVLLDGDRMPGAKWFPDARLNFAENLLRRRDAATAIVFWGEDRVKRRLTHRELYDLVSRTAQALRALGVKPDVSAVAGAQRLDEFTAGHPGGDIRFEQLPFDHPLYILFSSGTTGAPKCIVHGQGGTLLKHL